MSQRGPPGDGGRLKNDDDWYLCDHFMSSAPDSRSAIKSDFDWLWVPCEQAGVARPATVADVVAAAEAELKFHQELPLQMALVESQTEKVSALSAQCTP